MPFCLVLLTPSSSLQAKSTNFEMIRMFDDAQVFNNTLTATATGVSKE
jgi:hypothetical protein